MNTSFFGVGGITHATVRGLVTRLLTISAQPDTVKVIDAAET
jgi:hypothetical protein